MLNIDDSWTLFLDRDGVINQRIFGGYVTRPEELIVTAENVLAIEALSSVFGRCVVVTNQQCIAKGILSIDGLSRVHSSLKNMLKPGTLDGIYFAPEFANDPQNTRKPKPHMAQQAQRDFPEINFEKSVMVGDTDSDILFGQNLGMKTVLIRSEEKTTLEADYTVKDLTEWVQILKK